MTAQASIALLIGFATLLACARFAIGAGRQTGPRGRWWLLLAFQPLLAAALYLCLFPPMQTQPGTRLVVLTAGATAAQLAPHRSGALVIALPEAPALPGVTRMPDLGTALRRHPRAQRLLVLGAGLEARDRPAVSGRELAFERTQPAPGLVELLAPTQATVGAPWPVAGRVNAMSGGSAELIDPAGNKLQVARLDKQGRFSFARPLSALGRADFELRVRNAAGRLIETVPLPVHVRPGARPRVLVLAGGPGPELKYLRRWALDAGAELHTQIDVGAGLRLGDAPITWTPGRLGQFDLVVLDERAWRGLGASRKASLRQAMDAGLGVLLRLGGPLGAAERRELQALGFEHTPAGISAGDGVPMLVDASGAVQALRRNIGQGRMALWWRTDTHRLVLSGQADEHGRLWRGAFEAVARARAARGPWLASAHPRPGQRLVLCGLGPGAVSMRSPLGLDSPLVPVRRQAGHCAAYWPAQPGWHELRGGAQPLAVLVRGQEQLPGVHAAALGDATQLLVSGAPMQGSSMPSAQRVPGPRWPWFLAWCLLAAIGWWLERRCWRQGNGFPSAAIAAPLTILPAH